MLSIDVEVDLYVKIIKTVTCAFFYVNIRRFLNKKYVGGGGGLEIENPPHFYKFTCMQIYKSLFDANTCTCTLIMHINSTIYFGYRHHLKNAEVQYSCFCTNHRHLTKYIILATKKYTPYSYLKVHM